MFHFNFLSLNCIGPFLSFIFFHNQRSFFLLHVTFGFNYNKLPNAIPNLSSNPSNYSLLTRASLQGYFFLSFSFIFLNSLGVTYTAITLDSCGDICTPAYPKTWTVHIRVEIRGTRVPQLCCRDLLSSSEILPFCLSYSGLEQRPREPHLYGGNSHSLSLVLFNIWERLRGWGTFEIPGH